MPDGPETKAFSHETSAIHKPSFRTQVRSRRSGPSSKNFFPKPRHVLLAKFCKRAPVGRAAMVVVLDNPPGFFRMPPSVLEESLEDMFQIVRESGGRRLGESCSVHVTIASTHDYTYKHD